MNVNVALCERRLRRWHAGSMVRFCVGRRVVAAADFVAAVVGLARFDRVRLRTESDFVDVLATRRCVVHARGLVRRAVCSGVLWLRLCGVARAGAARV